MPEVEIGVVQHYFDKIGVGAIQVTAGELKVGDRVHIKGTTTDVTTAIESMQIEHDKVETAKAGDTIGMKLGEKVREHDKVFKVTEG